MRIVATAVLSALMLQGCGADQTEINRRASLYAQIDAAEQHADAIAKHGPAFNDRLQEAREKLLALQTLLESHKKNHPGADPAGARLFAINQQRSLLIHTAKLQDLLDAEREAKASGQPYNNEALAALQQEEREVIARRKNNIERMQTAHGFTSEELLAAAQEKASAATAERRNEEQRNRLNQEARDADARFRATQRPKAPPRTGD